MTSRTNFSLVGPKALSAGLLLSLALWGGRAHALYSYGGPINPWPGGVVPVCWETGLATDQYGGGNPQAARDYPGFAHISQVIRDAVQNGWGRAANLSFVGWNDCVSTKNTGNPGTVSIFFNPATHANTTIGYQSSQWTRSMINPTGDDATLSATVLHEMGHALGFAHELDRPDHTTTDPGCNYGNNTPGADYSVYDHDSIMNYSYCSNPGVLSALDIEGIRAAYGRKPVGSLVGDGGLCANAWGGGAMHDGMQIASFRCTGSTNDTWTYSPSAGSEIALFSNRSATPYCALGAGTANWVFTDACSGQAEDDTDSWTPTNVRILGYGERCLDTSGSFTPAVMNECSGALSQTWSLVLSGSSDGAALDGLVQIVNGNTTGGQQCLDVYNDADADGATVGVWTCNGQTNQAWRILPGGRLQPASSSRVLDVNNFGTADGTAVELFTEKSTSFANQQFVLRMSLATPSLSVLDVSGGQPSSLDEGTLYDVYPANGGPNQSFDYWP